MDTTHIAYTAEDLIAHKLQRYGLLVAKPKFDQNGADLIALDEVKDGAKFCRIQCKGRSIRIRNNTQVNVPEKYVEGAFILFLYIDKGDDNTNLFCFFVDDIKNTWKLKRDMNYYLYINKNSFDNLLEYRFETKTIAKIKDIIRSSHSTLEFKMFKLLRIAQELINKTKRLNKLKNIMTQISHLKEMQVYHDEMLKSGLREFEIICKSLKSELPDDIVRKIELLRDSGETEEEVINKTIRNVDNIFSRETLGLFISYMYNTHRNKL